MDHSQGGDGGEPAGVLDATIQRRTIPMAMVDENRENKLNIYDSYRFRAIGAHPHTHPHTHPFAFAC